MTGQKDLAWLWETLRNSSKPLTRKRMKKLTEQLSDAAIWQSLGLQEELHSRYIFLIEGHYGTILGHWNESGQIAHKIDDTHEVLRFAQTELLRRRRYPAFRSYDEAEAYAAHQSWPPSNPTKSSKS